MKFTDAGRNNDLPQLMQRASQRPHLLNATDRAGKTALMISVREQHSEVFAWLLDQRWRGLDVDARDAAGETALFTACHLFPHTHNYLEPLLRAGADASIPNARGHTCLMAAVFKNHQAVVARLLQDRRTPLNAQDDHGWCALHFAAENDGDGSMTRRLLRAGSSALACDKQHRLPVELARDLGRPAVVINMLEVNR